MNTTEGDPIRHPEDGKDLFERFHIATCWCDRRPREWRKRGPAVDEHGEPYPLGYWWQCPLCHPPVAFTDDEIQWRDVDPGLNFTVRRALMLELLHEGKWPPRARKAEDE